MPCICMVVEQVSAEAIVYREDVYRGACWR